MKTSFYSYTLPQLTKLFEAQRLHLSAPMRFFNWHYKQRKRTPCTEDIAKVTQAWVAEHLSFDLPEIDAVQLSDDRSVKFLFKLADGRRVETVLIPSKKKYGICLSSQVGCAMKCSFCHTGLQGLERHLSTHEIVGQLMAAQEWLTENRPQDDRIATIVFMGQGEPLHNFEAVRDAVEIFHTQNGLCFALDRITISTAGYLPGLQRWKGEMPDVNIALSLHSTDKVKRDVLIPINARYPVEDVLKVVAEIPRTKKRFIIYEYLLARGFNDGEKDARDLGEALKGGRAFVNLIPFNPFPGARFERPSLEEIKRFKATLDEYGVPSLVRITKGSEILAACGQLNSKNVRN